MPDGEVKATILNVEDEILVRMCGTDILQDAGFVVLEAGNADEALALLVIHHEVRLLFSDLDMPGSMDGLELARIVHERWPDIGLLLTSGQHQPSQAAIPDAGRFLSKPWTHDELIRNVRHLLAA